MRNKVSLILCISWLIAIIPLEASIHINFSGSSKQVICDIPESSTGLDAVYTVYDMKEISSVDISGLTSGADVKVMKYSNLGGGYAVDVPVSVNGSVASILYPDRDMGYMIEDGSNKYNFWIVDYSDKHLELSAVEANSEQDCDMTSLNIDGKGSAIHYYSINGRQCILSRDIIVSYTSLQWEDSQKMYLSIDKTVSLDYLQTAVNIRPAFYCNTYVNVSGDRFLKAWGLGESIESSMIQANGLEVYTDAVQTNATDDSSGQNMISSDDTMLGGSAPADFTFYAYPSDAVIHNEWQIADDSDFEYVRYRFNEQDLSYTFNEEGEFYVRYVGSNDDGSCVIYGETYEIGIGASDLRIPNAFSPDGDGVNDEWKVGYRSLTEFRCWIFDRNGQQLFYFDRPELGWDGKYKGKTVSPGVYYYVIEAKGADGVKYKKGGDINILRYKKVGSSADATTE